MKKIRKNSMLPDVDSVKSKLASYSAVAACVLATGFDASAQCGTASAGAPLPVDFAGDGVNDISIAVANFPGPYSVTMGTNMVGPTTITNPVSSTFTATLAAPGPGTSFNGCITTFYNGTVFTAIDPNATAMGSIMVTGSTMFYNAYVTTNYTIAYSVNLAYANATAYGNQLVGLTAGGSDVCAAIGGAATFAYLGTCYNYISIYQQVAYAGVYYNLVPSGTVMLTHPPCTTSAGNNAYAGFMQTLAYLPVMTGFPGPYPLGTIASGTASLGAACNPGSTFLGVEFAGGDGTQYGWVEVVFNPDGTITCVNTGYNGCSVEEVTAFGGAVGVDECIAVGAATVNTADEGCSDVPPPADVPTLSQWGLIALMLSLMSYGAIAMSNFGELAAILRRKQEELI